MKHSFVTALSAGCAVASMTLAATSPCMATTLDSSLDATKPSPENHCITEMRPVAPGSRDLQPSSRWCGTRAQRDERIRNNLKAYAPTDRRQGSGNSQVIQSAGVPLVTLYQYADWGGGSDTLNGPAPCDYEGYGSSNLSGISWWDTWHYDGISSYKTYSQCYQSQKYSGTGFSGAASSWLRGDQSYVGSQYNDHMYSLRVKRNQ